MNMELTERGRWALRKPDGLRAERLRFDSGIFGADLIW
jgi:hypothetical protein